MNSGYYIAAWNGAGSGTAAASVSDEQQVQVQQAAAECPHFGLPLGAAAAAAAQLAATITSASSTATNSWTLPVDFYHDHASLLECARCINQGHLKRYMGGGSGQGQGSMNIIDGELMQDLHYNIEEEDDVCIGMEMKMMKKRKLTSEQARQLEASFEADKKLEAEKKQRLAEQLGLQPRQVAVWFQNRRARSKTKQLEMDFLTLKAEYDRVLAQRRSLQAEIARLSAQLQARSSDTKNNTCSQDSTSSTSNDGDVVSENATLQVKMASSMEETEGLTSNFTPGKEGLSRSQDLAKSPNLQNYDWEPYDNGLWVFD